MGKLSIYLLKELMKFPRSKYNFEVADNDILKIGKKTKLVQVLGEVNSPGNYQYVKGFHFNDYVKLAGGYTRDASRNYSFVRHADGSSNKASYFNRYIKVNDGSIIKIGKKKELGLNSQNI